MTYFILKHFRAPVDIRDKLNFKEIDRIMQRAHGSSNPGQVKSLQIFEELILQWNSKYG